MKLNFLSKKFCRKKIISWVFLLCAFPSFLFSKNQIRLHKFDWEIAETPHFEVYYYPAVEDRLEEVISYLEEAYEETSAFFQYPLPRKIPFFIYENHLHFEENAIAPIGEETGGFSEPFKNRFVLPLFASQEELRHVIRHEFAHIVSFYLWYGGQWRSLSLARLYVYPIPLWIAEGIAEFTGNRPAKSIDEMAVREAFLGGYFVDLDKLGSFTHLEGYQVWQAYKQSENFFRFLKETYGDKEIREIVEEANKNFDVSSILEKTLKKDVFAVNRQWKEFLEKKYAFARVKKTPSEYGKLVSPDVPYSLSSSPAVRGDTLYFISSARGYDEIYARDIPGGKSRPLLKKRSFTYFDSLEKKYNSLACDKAGLWFSGNRNKRVYLLYLDEKKGKIKKKIRMDLDQITGIDVLDGERLVISAVKTGISDLYLFNHRTGETVRLTSDEFEERRFCRNGKTIYGSAERNYQKDLYIFDLDKKERRWLTDTPELTGNEEEDPWFYDGKLYFSADYDGIFNLYEAEFGGNGNLSGIRRLTDVRSGMFFPVAANGNFFFRGYERGSYSI
ncbi:MAG TPA: hypothetical protein VJC03_03735, partial [bacterium]|nr:hypothetical protein [bacterium]